MAFIDQQTVYPTNKDLAVTPGEGDVGLENNVSTNYYRQYQRNSFSDASAFVLSDPSSGFDVLLTGGAESGSHAMVRGHKFFMESTLTLKSAGNDVDVVGNIQANKHNHIFISINRDVNLEIDKMQITINTSGVQPGANGNSLKIGVAVTDGSTVTEIIDQRQSSILLPIFCEIPPRQYNSTSFAYGPQTYMNVPIIGQTTNLSIMFIAGAIGVPLNNPFDFDWKCELEGPGPDGLGLTQESTEQTFTTLKQLGSGGVPEAKTIHRGYIDLENEIGRFDGGLLKIRMAVKPSSFTETLITTYKSETGFEWDTRGGHRSQNWNALI